MHKRSVRFSQDAGAVKLAVPVSASDAGPVRAHRDGETVYAMIAELPPGYVTRVKANNAIAVAFAAICLALIEPPSSYKAAYCVLG